MNPKRTSTLFSLAAVAATVVLAAVGATAAEKPSPTRGQYLVESVAKCGDCHTPMTEHGEPDAAHLLGGTKLPFKPLFEIPGWAAQAPKIAGLPGWSEAAAIEFLMSGKTPNGVPAGPPMPAYRLNRQDAADVVAYLKSLP